MPKRNGNLLLEDIVESILKIESYPKGIDYNNFFKDEKKRCCSQKFRNYWRSC